MAVSVGEGLVRAGLWAAILGAAAGVVAAGAAVWPLIAGQPAGPVPPELRVPEWVVDRPAEMTAAVAGLLRGRKRLVGITTGVYGAGGFGKTTLAQLACADRRVRRRFGGRVYLVTVGRDVQGAPTIAAKVNDVIRLVTGLDANFTDPELAGQRLGSLLDAGPRRLLVVDDVWEPGQLAPLATGGRRCARLVTTRVPGLLTGAGAAVRVDQMSREQARSLLTSGLPALDASVTERLLAVTGRWPLLLRLVNKVLANVAQTGQDLPAAASALIERLGTAGPTAVDDLLGDMGRELDVNKPHERAQAVRATIEASTSLLDPQAAERFAELAVFAEDEVVPFSLIAKLWRATAGVDALQAAQVCARLRELALVSAADTAAGDVAIHDVVRDLLRGDLGPQRLAVLLRILVDAVAADLPSAIPLPSGSRGRQVAWWELGTGDRYIWDHLIEHVLAAGRPEDAEAVACDLRWVGERLKRFGPAAPAADLSLLGTPRAGRLLDVLARASHLLAPTDPPGALLDVLRSRVAEDPDWGPQSAALPAVFRPRLVSRWPLPDLRDPALRRLLPGHTGGVRAADVAPHGRWLAVGCADGSVRIWDVLTGRAHAILSAQPDQTAFYGLRAMSGFYDLRALAVSPDGTWLAVGIGRTVRIWDTATWQGRLRRHAALVQSIAVAPDGRWMAVGGGRRKVRIWDTVTWRTEAKLTSPSSPPRSRLDWARRPVVTAMAVSPDGNWLAAGDDRGAVRIWDTATWQTRATKMPESRWTSVGGLTVAGDGSWLAADISQALWIWDTRTWEAQEKTWEAQEKYLTGRRQAAAALGGRLTVRPHRRRRPYLGHNDTAGSLRFCKGGGCTGRHLVCDERGYSGADLGCRERAEPNHKHPRWPRGNRHRSGAGRELASGQRWRTGSADPGHPDRTAPRHPRRPFRQGALTSGRARWQMASCRRSRQERAHLGYRHLDQAPDADVQHWRRRGDGRICGRQVDGHKWSRPDHPDLGYHVLEGPRHSRGPHRLGARSGGSSRWQLAGHDQIVRIWDASSWRPKATLVGHDRRIEAVTVAPDGSWLGTGSADGTVKVWDTATWRFKATLTSNARWVMAVAAAPDGRWLAAGSGDGTVRIWEAANWSASAMMRVDNEVRACAWIAAGAVAAGGPAGLYVFNLLDGDHEAALND